MSPNPVHKEHRSKDPSARGIAVCEILSLLFTLLIGAWAIPALSDDRTLLPVPIVAGVLFILLSMRIRGETPYEIGFRIDNFAKAGVMVAIPMAVAALVMIGLGVTFGSLRLASPASDRDMFLFPLAGIAWGTMQQFALQGFVNRRAQIIWGPGWQSCLLVGALFGIFHLPNIWLSVATFLGGLVWAVVYQRTPNLFALGLSHAVMTFVLICTVPANALQHLGIGFRLWLP